MLRYEPLCGDATLLQQLPHTLTGSMTGIVIVQAEVHLPELRELVSLLRYSSNNLNQLTRRVHETGRVYAADMEDILQNQERIWQAASGILSRLASIK